MTVKRSVKQTRTLLVEDKNGKFKVTIPAGAKVTFGALHGSSDKFHQSGNVLRIYETKERQIAVFTNVIAFRDLALPIERMVAKMPDGKHLAPVLALKAQDAGVSVEEVWVEEAL
jgi:hypothetical protein